MKTLNVEDDVHQLLIKKNEEFKQKNHFELPLGIMVGMIVKKYIYEVDFSVKADGVIK